MTNQEAQTTVPLLQRIKQNHNSSTSENIQNSNTSLGGKIKKGPGRKKGSTKKLKNNLVPTPFDFGEFCDIGKTLKFQPESQAISAPMSPDVSFGALLMSHLRNHCESCWTVDTPQWRKGWYSPILGRVVLLCNACGLKYHKNQFCSYCKFVYGKEIDKTSPKFITCTECEKCVHVECEKRYGNWSIWAKQYHMSESAIRAEYICAECSPAKCDKSSAVKSLLDLFPLKKVEDEEDFDHFPNSSLPSSPHHHSEDLKDNMDIVSEHTPFKHVAKHSPFASAFSPSQKKHHHFNPHHHDVDEPDYSSATSPLHISHIPAEHL